MPITSGSIRYERRLPKDDANSWNYKHVVAEIHWTVEPDEMEEDLAAYAGDKVVMRVRDVLNWKPAVPDTTFVPSPSQAEDIQEAKFDIAAERIKSQRHIEPNIVAPDLATAVAEITAGIPPTLKRHRRTKAEMEAARAAAAEDAKTNRYGETILPDPTLTPEIPIVLDGAEPGSERVADPTESSTMVGEPVLNRSSNGTQPELGSKRVANPTTTPSSPEPGMPSFDPEPKPPAEVTDLDLQNACQARASGGLPHATIKELVAKFSPGALVQTPQDARRRFLDELAKL